MVALDQILNSPVYTFNYKPEMGTGDSETTYVGIMADEAPWAMHYDGTLVSLVNTLGYMVLGTQALNQKISDLSLETENKVKELDLKIEEIVSPIDEDNKTFSERFYDKLISWLGSDTNGLEQICVKKSDGSQFCVNGDQLEQVVNNLNNEDSLPQETEEINPEPEIPSTQSEGTIQNIEEAEEPIIEEQKQVEEQDSIEESVNSENVITQEEPST
jgi:hypothetical protein